MTTQKSNDTEKNKKLSLHLMVPNMMTIMALCMGLTSIQYAIDERWEKSVIAIVIAAFIDGFDGAVARMLNAESRLGAELDSFSDFLCFGVAPAIVLHLWSLHEIGRFGWMASLIFCVAVALRLARFNASMKSEESSDDKDMPNGYFTGVPAPAGGGLCILPLIIGFLVDEGSFFFDYVHNPYLVAVWLTLVATLMVSRIPTFSSKKVHISQKMAVPALASFGLLVAGIINAPWPTLTLMGVIYTLLIPVSVVWFYYEKKQKI